MAKQKASDWIPVYNSLAKKKGVAQIPVTAKMTLDEIADKIEWVNNLAERNTVAKKKRKSFFEPHRPVEHECAIQELFKIFMRWIKEKSLQY